ncbi:MAG TPA: outer membrane lipoprotein carrier protein LolA [Chthoniobacterales bacterium]|nr:outer membrane lipoprotein carrier protein LolA [Chthoniobacterales bacterium]
MMSRFFFLLLVCFVATSLASAAPMTSDEINDLVKKLESHYENRISLQANFREERHMSILKEALVNQGKLWYTPPDKFRREIEGNQPSTTVIDGKQMTIYYPNLKTAERYNLDKRPELKNSIQAITAGLNFQRLGDYYNIEGTKDGKLYHVTLTPKTASIRKMVKTVTITVQQDLTPEAVDLETARGEKVSITYSNVKRDSVSDSTYQFNPPAGTNITTPFGS